MTYMYFDKSYSGDGGVSFLPAPQYWIDREDAILSFLSMRGRSVPKVIFKDSIKNTVRLEDVGESLHNILKYRNIDVKTEISWILRRTVEELISIFRVGVLHLDVSARNVTVNIVERKIYILDFGHAIYTNLELLKPIPLLPTSGIHHSELYRSLLDDWKRYFEDLGRPAPDFENKFDINNSEFANYWSADFSVQRLMDHDGVLAHGVANLIQEVCEISEMPMNYQRDLLNFANQLRELDHGDGILVMSDLISFLTPSGSISEGKEKKANFSNSTPIPRVKISEQKIERRSEGIAQEKDWKFYLRIRPAFFIMCAGLVFGTANVYVLDRQVESYGIRFSSKEISLIIDASIVVLSVSGLSFLIGSPYKEFFRKVGVLVGCVLLGWVQLITLKASSSLSITLFLFFLLSSLTYFFKKRA